MARGKRPSIGREVDRLVATLDLTTASADQVSAVAEQIRALGQEAIERLARGILRPGPARREKVTALLACLSGEAASWALAALRTLPLSRRLSPMEHVWLSATVRRLVEAASPSSEPTPSGAARRPALADPTELLLWRDELDELPPAAQQAALAPVLDTGDPAFLPVLEMALSLGSPAIDAAVAQGLARFATPAALPLVRELLRHADPAVRAGARQSLLALARRGVPTRELFVAAPEPDEGAAVALATRPDATGRMAVLIARRRDFDLLDYAVVTVDPIELGLVDAWGDSGLTETQFRERLADYADEAGLEFDPTALAVAQGIVAAAEAYTRQQGQAMPPDYLAWRRLIGAPAERVVLPIVFGPSCAECGARLRGEDPMRGGLVAGEVALCAACAARPRRCARCGRLLHRMFDEFSVRMGKGEVEFFCRACGRSEEGR